MNAPLVATPVLRQLQPDADQKIAVFRALNLGDMLCTIPALRALRARFPAAHIVLIGLESARPVLQHFPQYIDELLIFPGDPAFPEQPVRHDALPLFYQQMRERHFDLVLQLHGSGPQSNRIVQEMAPAQWAGFVPEVGQAEFGRLFPWPDHLHEVHRYLALLEHLGLETDDDTLEFPLAADDESRAERLAHEHGLQLDRTIFVHAGARLASRRWPLERYAAVASALATEGWQIALTGSPGESAMAQQIQEVAPHGAHYVNLCGTTELGTLAGLLRRGRLLICNDTGISHVAASVKAPSVVIASGSDVGRWAPLDKQRHTVMHTPMACRPCAYDECPIGHPCALGVEVEHVLAQARRHLEQGRHP